MYPIERVYEKLFPENENAIRMIFMVQMFDV